MISPKRTTPANVPEGITVGVLGLGHVGLPTALGFAELGWQVLGADDDRTKAQALAGGKATFYEEGLSDLLHRHLASGRFQVAPDIATDVRQAQVIFVCVGTPQREDGSADLSQVEAVARAIAPNINGYKLIVEKSTTPVRTAEQIKRTLQRYTKWPSRPGHEGVAFEVAVNPEFLREGKAIYDFFNPDRIVLGVESERARDLLVALYRPLFSSPGQLNSPSVRNGIPARIVVTSLNTAEIIKHSANAFLATKISFINLVADLCEATGADVAEVAHGLGLDPRIGQQFLQAGLGFGGYCLPKDLRAFIRIGQENGLDFSLFSAVEQINNQRVDRLLAKVQKALWVMSGKTISVLGLAFKPSTDDIRDAPSLKVVRRLLEEGASLRLHDPEAMDNFRLAFPEKPPSLTYWPSPYEAATGAQALLVLTEWDQYRNLELARIRELMDIPIIVDGRNIYSPSAVRSLGFDYFCLGRP
jgi:UDPglucose 6-dehydrogenase